MGIKKLIDKYLKKNKNNEEKIIHKMNASVLVKTDFHNFKQNNVLVDEIIEYAKEQGIKIDKIIFYSFFDLDLSDDIKSIKSHSDNKIEIVENENNEIIAKVFLGSWIKYG